MAHNELIYHAVQEALSDDTTIDAALQSVRAAVDSYLSACGENVPIQDFPRSDVKLGVIRAEMLASDLQAWATSEVGS